jgi:hypothetical protein
MAHFPCATAYRMLTYTACQTHTTPPANKRIQRKLVEGKISAPRPRPKILLPMLLIAT